MKHLQVHRTADGSHTLFNAALNESYHSMYGAVTESLHVFIRNGLHVVAKPTVDLLEIGLGTGLNMLLTWIDAERSGATIHYTAIEPSPVAAEVLEQLDHCRALGAEEKRDAFMAMMTSATDLHHSPSAHLGFVRAPGTAQLAASSQDLIYYDAFAPTVQPELWTTDHFQRMHGLLRPGGFLVTYSAKGTVRRALQQVGFSVERLTGPPGKQEMLRATKNP